MKQRFNTVDDKPGKRKIGAPSIIRKGKEFKRVIVSKSFLSVHVSQHSFKNWRYLRVYDETFWEYNTPNNYFVFPNEGVKGNFFLNKVSWVIQRFFRCNSIEKKNKNKQPDT